MSALTVGVVLFLINGIVYVVIGVLAPLLLNSETDQILIVSPRSDAVVFGRKPADLLRADPQLAQLRTILMSVIAGLLVTAGILIIGVTWFALREGQPWALAVLAIAGLAVLPFWILVFRPYLAAGAPLALGDLPPFMWIPSALIVPAIVASWIGLRP